MYPVIKVVKAPTNAIVEFIDQCLNLKRDSKKSGIDSKPRNEWLLELGPVPV
jgi:hypothetical protein